jgi:hypothetical protein
MKLWQEGLIFITAGIVIFSVLYSTKFNFEQDMVQDLQHQKLVLENLSKQDQLYKKIVTMNEIEPQYLNQTLLQSTMSNYTNLKIEYQQLDPNNNVITIGEMTMLFIIKTFVMYLLAPSLILMGFTAFITMGIKHVYKRIKVTQER